MSSALVESQNPSQVSASSDQCEKCYGPLGDYAVCPNCGYYAKLGHYVEIDHEMEGQIEKEPEPFRLPKWSYVTIAGGIAIVAEAITLSFILPVNSIDRLACSILHLVVGCVLLAVVQIRATFLTLLDDPSTTLVDCICFPPKAWEAIVQRLPNSAKFIHMLVVGTMAILMSLIVLRAIPWKALFTNEPPPKYKPSVLVKIINKGAGDSEESLEEALESFTEQAVADGEAEEAKERDSENEISEMVQNARCIVIGYFETESEPKTLRSMVVATADRNPLSSNKWKILGTIPVLDEQVAAGLHQQLQSRITPMPFTPSNMKAIWVQPSIRCQVSFQERGEERSPVNLELQRIF